MLHFYKVLSIEVQQMLHFYKTNIFFAAKSYIGVQYQPSPSLAITVAKNYTSSLTLLVQYVPAWVSPSSKE